GGRDRLGHQAAQEQRHENGALHHLILPAGYLPLALGLTRVNFTSRSGSGCSSTSRSLAVQTALFWSTNFQRLAEVPDSPSGVKPSVVMSQLLPSPVQLASP